jgi:hypothetical protein
MHKIALVLAIAAVGEGLLALHLVRQLHEERASAQALQARLSELERRAPQPAAEAAFPAAPAQPAAAPFTVVDPGAPVSSPEPVRVPHTAVRNEAEAAEMRKHILAASERQRALLRDPEYREAMVAQQKMALLRMNPDIARDLDLTPEQLDRLYTTMGEHYVRRMETEQYLGDVTTDPEGVSAKMHEANRKSAELREIELAEIRKLLGDAKFREFEQYQSMFGARAEAARIRESLAVAGVPLDDDLAMPLARIIHEQQQKLAQSAIPVTPGSGRLLTSVGVVHQTARIVNDAESQRQQLESMEKYQREQREALARLLSPEQLQVIEEEQEAMLQLGRAQLRVIQAQQ